MVVPLGIQLFDWGENLFYVLAIHNHPGAGTVPAIYAGLVFKWLKAACVFPTTLLTPVFLAYFLYGRVRGRLRRGHATGEREAQAATPAHERVDR